MLLLLLVASFLDPMLGHPLSRIFGGKWIAAAARIWIITSLFAFVAVKLVAALSFASGIAAKLVSSRPTFDPARRNFFRYASYFAGGLPFVAAVYGFATGRFKYRVEEVEVPIAGLPKALDGLRIAQLSDIHIGDYMPREEVRRAVEMTNALRPDLAVVTGDFISSEYDPLEACIAELSQLRAPLGTWGCNGNHEIYADAEDSAQGLFNRYGMRLLRQENATLEHRGEKFNLIGVDYQRDHMTRGPRGPMLQRVEHLISREIPNILLSHNPNSFHRAAELGIELSLAGHTHGGQVKFEIVDRSFSPARLITDFVAGLYHLPMGNGATSTGKKAFLYVNRGLGTFGMPVRLGVPPEITLLTLRAV
jgi:predicted MPP superfamily phosphohydrolase